MISKFIRVYQYCYQTINFNLYIYFYLIFIHQNYLLLFYFIIIGGYFIFIDFIFGLDIYVIIFINFQICVI